MSTYAIGDIHGCLKTFKALLDRINFNKEDTLFLLGDYIDRGPDSKGVIDFIWQLQQTGYTIHCLKGNHEQMLYKGMHDADQTELYHQETLQSFGVNKIEEIPNDYLIWIKGLPYYLEWKKYILVHAGLGFAFPLQNPFEEKRDMLWIRHWYDRIDKEWLEDRIIIHGHNPVRRSEIETLHSHIFSNQYLNIDSGCYYSTDGYGQLCCYAFEANSLVFQQNIDYPDDAPERY